MQQMANGNAISIDNGPKYSRVKVQVTGPHAGFHSTVTAVQAAMRRAGVGRVGVGQSRWAARLRL